jgi:hypothetical protein
LSGPESPEDASSGTDLRNTPAPVETHRLNRDVRAEELVGLLDRVPEGWTAVTYRARPYGLRRTSRADGRSVAVYAEELGGTDVVSTNIYRTSGGDVLRPCEMPASVVLAFLEGWRPTAAPVSPGDATPEGPDRPG